MGGINCNNPRLTPGDIGGKSEAYIGSLAQYCASLFDGAATFFAANAKIEQAVMCDGPVDEAIALLSSSESGFLAAVAHLNTVASLYQQIDPSGHEQTDFVSQLDTLSSTARMIATARMELELMPDAVSTQASLWAHQGLTENFIAAMESVCRGLSWQGEFAKQNTPVRIS